MSLGFFFLPMLVIVPAKFTMCFTLGSILFLSGFAIWNGPKKFVLNLCSGPRSVFFVLYLLSLSELPLTRTTLGLVLL